GPAVPGIGWAAGVERLSLMPFETPAAGRPVAVIPVGDAAQAPALRLAQDLRRAGIRVDLGYSGNMKRRMARANKANARFALMLGEDELAQGAATLRDLDSGAQESVALDAVVGRLAATKGDR
ncbi:MAG TPA: His/Gly/Thr/Pro-type tRNA ligase C-terminal domain-containing protein, partial [Alphaproteobacteria bacterium]|nr:His/Gly/Thr/Pro-type tRNA ligase C-terminal domain-containing protein [Alphaproteobacteria bacterium]